MGYDPQIHHRRSLRLPEFDYSSEGAYFITLCTRDRKPLFGRVMGSQVRLNRCGEVVKDCWLWLSRQYSYVELDEWILMPNHLHGILVITDNGRGGSRTAPTHNPYGGIKRKPLGRLVGAFKTVSTKQINKRRGSPGLPIWQRNYYENVIRDQQSLDSIRQYISNNPVNWALDPLHFDRPIESHPVVETGNKEAPCPQPTN